MVENQNRLLKIAVVDFVVEKLPIVFYFLGRSLADSRCMF